MSYETKSMSNFSGVDQLQETLNDLKLLIAEPGGDKHELNVGERIELLTPVIREIAIAHSWGVDLTKINKAIEKTKIPAADVWFVAIAENRKMKLRETVFQCDFSDLNKVRDASYVDLGVSRSKALMSRRDGFDLAVFLVLGRELQPGALKPYRFGTILASVSYEIRPARLGNGIRPRPLTPEVAELHMLADKTVLFVDQRSDLLSANNLDDAVAIYVDEELLRIIGTNRSSESKVIQRDLVIDSLKQLVFMMSRELAQNPNTGDLPDSAVIDVFEFQLSKILPKRKRFDRQELIKKIEDSPAVIASMFSNLDSHRSSIVKLIVGEEE